MLAVTPVDPAFHSHEEKKHSIVEKEKPPKGRVFFGTGVSSSSIRIHETGGRMSAWGEATGSESSAGASYASWCGALKNRCRILVESSRFALLTTALTLYALFGDDFRLSATSQGTDMVFNFVTIICITVFSVEIFAACVGKDEYFLGFFFILDVGSTITLIFDLTWVWNTLVCHEMSSSSSGALRSSRAGRAGARAARTVRIIRLIRLVKLYKSWTEDSRKKAATHAPGEEEQEDAVSPEDEDEVKNAGKTHVANKTETRVGKKLSDMTTRRVILLVLVMLFVMPMFSPTFFGWDEYKTSGEMGAELIYDRLRQWCLIPQANSSSPWCLSSHSTPADSLADERYGNRATFEEEVLNYIYVHHDNFYGHKIYWIGLNSDALSRQEGADAAAARLVHLGRMNQEIWLGSHVSRNPAEEWNARYADRAWGSTLTNIDEVGQGKLTSPWTESCNGFVGVPVGQDSNPFSATCSVKNDLRCSELLQYFPLTRTDAENDQLSMMFVFDVRSTSQLGSGLSMLQTVFICFAVGLGAMSFTKDANQLLLKPIERMIQKMELIKDDPLYAMKMGDIEYRREEIMRMKREEKLRNMNRFLKIFWKVWRTQTTHKEPMETVILEKTIIKLGGLLALGFGEAGAKIIGANMRGGASAGVAMIPGQRVEAIIGFCSIRHFTLATDTLKEKVMIFVNQVGEIVHGCVDDYLGAPNKNIGDCFLLVWRLSGSSREKQTKLTDMSIMSAVAIVAEVNKSRVLAAYREHPGLLQRVPKWRVQMNFGLHCGWAIEGAIGSEFKIDASYLSPNVEVGQRLQAETEKYGVWILLSHFLINMSSPEMGGYCRLIDHVTVKGSRQPVRLFTIDLDYLSLSVQPRPEGLKLINRFKMRQVRELFKSQKLGDDYQVSKVFSSDEEIRLMRSKYTPDFFYRFATAYRNYEAGQWMVCRDMLLTCHYYIKDEEQDLVPVVDDISCWPEDGPVRTLLHFIRDSDFVPPSDWPGHRELREK